MVLSVSGLAEPIGSVKTWLRANNTIAIPSGWLICDGSTVVDASSAYNGKVLPDFRGRFVRGHGTLDNSNFNSDTIYFAGGTIPNGGTDSNNVGHSHNTSSHSHQISAGSFSMPVSGGSPSMTTDFVPNHRHAADLGNPFSGGGLAFTGPGGHTTFDGSHSHTVNAGRTGNNDQNFFTNSAGGGTDSQLGSIDNRPAYRELVVIIKIK